ncbi:MAG: hypothetical protein H6736_01370 [Alphaproteobacteria bacterium]|nr:hypothetical protein [Alphaproteobacteria bacterium]MCB9690440.1 hypothetical protein [Alphaproteobacteria bacterium]
MASSVRRCHQGWQIPDGSALFGVVGGDRDRDARADGEAPSGTGTGTGTGRGCHEARCARSVAA